VLCHYLNYPYDLVSYRKIITISIKSIKALFCELNSDLIICTIDPSRLNINHIIRIIERITKYVIVSDMILNNHRLEDGGIEISAESTDTGQIRPVY